MGDSSDSEREVENHSFENYKPALLDCLKLTSEIHGVNNISEDVFEEMYENCVYILKLIIQQGIKFMDKNNHLKMTTEDVRLGMKSRGFEPVYGYIDNEPINYKHARAGGKEFFFVDDKEIDLNEFVNAPLPKVPLECGLKISCLAIRGVPPKRKEKNIPITFQEQAISSAGNQLQNSKDIGNPSSKVVRKYSEKAMVREAIPHELSLEQQHYFIEITDACICNEESRRIEALESLMSDTGLAPMLPRFCHFIFLGVKASAAQNSLAILIYLMRMCKALVDNSSQTLQPYLDEILPSVLTCITSRQLCLRPDVDNHWALREYSASLLCQICRTFNTNANRLQSRVCNFLLSILNDETAPLASQFGAFCGFGELGSDFVINYVLPHVPVTSLKISSILDNSVGMVVVSNIDKNAAINIKNVLLKIMTKVIADHLKKPPDYLDDYQNEYGLFLGPLLYEAVIKHRQQTLAQSQNVSQFPSSLVLGRCPILPLGPPRHHQNNQSQLIRVSSNPRNSFATMVPPGTPARQNVVLIAPQQRFQQATPNIQPANAPHLLRLIPAGSTTNQPSTPHSFTE